MAALKGALGHPYLLTAAGILLFVGYLCWRWAARHDLKGLATDAAIQIAWNKGSLDTETESGNRLKALQSNPSHLSKATTVAGYATRHVLSRFVNWFGLSAMASGLALAGLAFYLG